MVFNSNADIPSKPYETKHNNTAVNRFKISEMGIENGNRYGKKEYIPPITAETIILGVLEFLFKSRPVMKRHKKSIEKLIRNNISE
jgi:hypothetical protein